MLVGSFLLVTRPSCAESLGPLFFSVKEAREDEKSRNRDHEDHDGDNNGKDFEFGAHD